MNNQQPLNIMPLPTVGTVGITQQVQQPVQQMQQVAAPQGTYAMAVPDYLMTGGTYSGTQMDASIGGPYISSSADKQFTINFKGNEVKTYVLFGILVSYAPIDSAARKYFKGVYVAGSSAPPDCWSPDGKTPAGNVVQPPSYTCAGCPMDVKGSGGADKKACRSFKNLGIILTDENGNLLPANYYGPGYTPTTVFKLTASATTLWNSEAKTADQFPFFKGIGNGQIPEWLCVQELVRKVKSIHTALEVDKMVCAISYPAHNSGFYFSPLQFINQNVAFTLDQDRSNIAAQVVDISKIDFPSVQQPVQQMQQVQQPVQQMQQVQFSNQAVQQAVAQYEQPIDVSGQVTPQVGNVTPSASATLNKFLGNS